MIERENHLEYVVAGVATMAIPVLLLALGIVIPGFSIDFDLHGHTFSYNLSMYLYVVLVFLGMWIMACYFRAVRIKPSSPGKMMSAGRDPGQYRAVSLPWSRLAAGVLLVAVGVLAFSWLGIGFSDRNKIGLWLYLGGPSVSFPSGIIPLIVGMVLILYAMAATKVVVMHESNGLLTIQELRPFTSIRTAIHARDVRAVHTTNAATGPRLLWIAFFSFQAFLLLIDGISFLSNPHAFGSSFLVGGMYMFSACVQLVALVLLLFGGMQSMSIITDGHYYNLNYFIFPNLKGGPGKARPSVIEKCFGRVFPSAFTGDKREQKHPVDFKRLVLGLWLLLVPIVSRAFNVYTGELVWLPFLVFGAIELVQWVKVDFAGRGSTVSLSGSASGGSLHVVSSRGWFHDEYLVIDAGGQPGATRPQVDQAPVARPRLLFPPDHLVLIGVAFLVGFDILTTIMLAPPGSPFTPGAITIHLVLGIGLLVFLLVTTFDPREILQVKCAHWTFQVSFLPQAGKQGWLSRVARVVRQRPTCLLWVIIELAVAFLLGMGLTLAFYF